MSELLTIKWHRGRMHIHMSAFFPCTAVKFNKLLKVIRMDNNEEAILQTSKSYFTEQMAVQEARYREYAKVYWRYQQAEADSKRRVEHERYPNGVPLTKDELKKEKERLKVYATIMNDYRRTALRAKKDKEWFEKFAEQLSERSKQNEL